MEWEAAIRKAYGLPADAPVVDVEEVGGQKPEGGGQRTEENQKQLEAESKEQGAGSSANSCSRLPREEKA